MTSPLYADLIERLEKASEGSRELDEVIALAVLENGGKIRLLGQPENEPPLKIFRYHDGSQGTALRYSTSLDAALQLVPPEANCWGIDIDPKNTTAYVSRTYVKDGHWFIESDGNTPALALCIASLKARAFLSPAQKTET